IGGRFGRSRAAVFVGIARGADEDEVGWGRTELVGGQGRGLDADAAGRSEETGPAAGRDDDGDWILAVAGELGQVAEQQRQGDVEQIDAGAGGDLEAQRL